MRKIKRLTQLRKEERRLREHRAELERAIQSDWLLIRRTLEPASLATEAFRAGTTWIGKKLLTGLTSRKTTEKSRS
ncbi:MAG TPA: hypothetical protein VN616_12285 [Puia sp.]|nr:hypothetical protein [Puia sp.]